MPTIEIEVKNKIAKSPAEHIVCGNSDYEIKFLFDEEWAAHNVKTARFIWNGQHEDVAFTGDTCNAPVISGATVCEVGVFAGNLHTTTPALVTCEKSVLCKNSLPADPNPDVYAQLMELLDKMGGGNLEAVKQAVAEYMAENPVNENDPTVPEWAKQKEKPTYTAAEVGALPAAALLEAVNAALAQAKASGEFDGKDGQDGKNGADGKTPIKGEDYFTEADKQEIAEAAADLVEVPEATMKPLTFTGAVNATYDGSEAVSVNIPFGGGSGGGEGGSSGWKKVAEYVWDGNKEYQPLTLDYATGEMTFDTAPPTNRCMWPVPNMGGIVNVTDLISLYSKIPNEFMNAGYTSSMALGENGYTFGGKTTLVEGGANANVDVSAFRFETSNTVPTFSGLNAKKVKIRMIAPGGNEWLSNSSFNFQVKLSNGTTCHAYSQSDGARVLLNLIEQTFSIDGNVFSSSFELNADRFQSRSNGNQGARRIYEKRLTDRRIVPNDVTIAEVSYPGGNGNYRPCNGTVVEVYVYED